MNEEVGLLAALLDKQIVDSEGRPVGRVDDVELRFTDGGEAPRAQALLVGLQALGERLGGRLGGGADATARRLRADGDARGPAAVPIEYVAETGSLVRLTVPLRSLAGLASLETWLAHHVIAPIPGTGDARE